MFRQVRTLASGTEAILAARKDVNRMLETYDRSSYILGHYIPEPARDAFLAIRAFNVEINKIQDGGNNPESVSSRASSQLSNSMGISTSDIKFRFWTDMLTRAFTQPDSTRDIGEPICTLLREAVRNDMNLDISYFHRIMQTRRQFLNDRQFQTVDAICSYGEGTYSQLNYATQGLLLSPSISPSSIRLLENSPDLQTTVSDIAAHIGQATAVSSMILGLEYYSKTKNLVTLPVDIMTKYDLSQESVLRLMNGHTENAQELREKLKNVVYETAITANDHMITARAKLKNLKEGIVETVRSQSDDELLQRHSKKWRKNVPDAIFTPFMVAVPTSLYLRKLERFDFDILHPKFNQKEWRLAWTSFRNYYQRRL